MYNTKVTLTLRRSQSRSNGELKKNFEEGKESLKRIHRNNSFNVEHRKPSMDQNWEENQIDSQVREGYSPQRLSRYYFGETPDFPQPIPSQQRTETKQSCEGVTGQQGQHQVPEVRNGAPPPPPLSSKPHLQQTVCFIFR